MAGHSTPHYHNDSGADTIEIGVREFMCVGARPPFDHPHIFIDMGTGNDAVCSYCATHFRFSAALGRLETLPPGHLFIGIENAA